MWMMNAVVAVMLLALVACGSDDDPSENGPEAGAGGGVEPADVQWACLCMAPDVLTKTMIEGLGYDWIVTMRTAASSPLGPQRPSEIDAAEVSWIAPDDPGDTVTAEVCGALDHVGQDCACDCVSLAAE